MMDGNERSTKLITRLTKGRLRWLTNGRLRMMDGSETSDFYWKILVCGVLFWFFFQVLEALA